jgi:hypothetical protein
MKPNDPFLHDDAAYVLGALDDGERDAFEEHLVTCPECQRRVAEITPTAGLLADLTGADLAEPGLFDERPPDTLLPGLLRRVRRERHRRWTTAVASMVAAACIAAVVVLAAGHHSGSSTSPSVAMTAVVQTPVHATAALTDVAWGTRISLQCRYDTAYPADVEYNLVVTDRSGVAHPAGSWALVPGQTTNFTGGTALHRDQISLVTVTVGKAPILELRP